MSYLVLARKYRSETFDDVVGQDHVAQTLKKAIATGRVAHAFLFCGTRGTGKTSMARILAKSLNCLAADAPTVKPCLKCPSCTAIARGDDVDVLEIDAASNTQVDKTRQAILDDAQYRPFHSRFKIYIIDEAHMLSKHSFNALLKTLEEPPSHVKFILATTEPEKILPTILSRCQRYDFRNIPTRQIAAHLADICKHENIKADEDALLLIARAGAGSMRDAISFLERMLSAEDRHLTAHLVEQILGLPRAQQVFDLVQAIAEGRVKDTLSIAGNLTSAGLTLDALAGALIDHMRDLLVAGACGADSDLLDGSTLSAAELVAQARLFDPAALSQDIVVLEELRRQMRTSLAARALLDAALVRLALSDQFTPLPQLLAGAVSAPAQKKKPDLNPAAPGPQDIPDPASPTPPRKSAATEPSAGLWPALLAALDEKGAALSSGLSMARLGEVTEDNLTIVFAPQGETFARMWARNGKKDQIRDAVCHLLNRNVSVTFVVEEAACDQKPPGPASSRPNARPESAPEAPESQPIRALTPDDIEKLRQDPLIAALMDQLQAKVVQMGPGA